MTVLTHYEPDQSTDQRGGHGPLPKLARAIDFNQRKVMFDEENTRNISSLYPNVPTFC